MSYPIRQRGYRLGEAIPGASTNPDTYNDRQDWFARGVENVVGFWSNAAKEGVGSFSSGIGKGLASSFGVSESTMWLIAGGLLLYLVMQKKGRR